MQNGRAYTVKEKFLEYVTIDTQSDPQSVTVPSTAKQKNLGTLLVAALQAMGIADAHLDEYGYVYATIAANTHKNNVPVVCLCSHMDTSPDCSGAGVKPVLHENYNGRDIHLPDDATQIITTSNHPYLLEKIGEDIITASGTTLLGADNKAGIAIIMNVAELLLAHDAIPHGTVKILFTPDEEIGRGVDHVDLQKLGADVAYTLDGGKRGSYTDETFSADAVTVTFKGISTHPGYAKNKLVNAIKIAGTFLELLPKDAFSPETTGGREGFVHPVHISGQAEGVAVQFIIRDFDTDKLKLHEARLEQFAKQAVGKYPGAGYTFDIKEQYRNMKQVVDQHPTITENVKIAMERAGVAFKKESARGGTDGSRLSFMGLPCPDIFTGEMAFHGKQEYVSVQDMEKSVDVVLELLQVWEQQA